MKAIIVSAGQGKRLLPLTEDTPKCLLPVLGEKSMLEVQLEALARCGVPRVSVMVGFGAEKVEQRIAENPIDGLEVETCYNPFYAMSDNLATVWLARSEMDEDFVLINGDTLFEEGLLERVLKAADAPITVTISRKDGYDDDDMKVSLGPGDRLTAIGKTLNASETDGESIGMLVFKGVGVKLFSDALDTTIRTSVGLRAWYLSVIHEIASSHPVETADISDLWWGEVDSVEDLAVVRGGLEERKHRS